jgi:anti-sigma regulatory factor (Ser/Thr protein kinase)
MADMRNPIKSNLRLNPGRLAAWFKNRTILFLILNAAFWASYFLFLSLIHASAGRYAPQAVLNAFEVACCGFGVCWLMRLVYGRIRLETIRLLPLLLLMVAATVGSALLLDLCNSLIDRLAARPQTPVASNFRMNPLSMLFYFEILLFAWSVLYFVVHFWMLYMEQKSRTQRADLLAKHSQLLMLRYQLNPHFLFNALNSARALIDEDEKNAKAMITELSEFLRYSLVSKNDTDVPLSQEIEAIRHYFSIEKKRYEEKLDVGFNIAPLAEDYPVVPFLLHPLVENAVKYGMRTSPLPLRIRISADVADGRLRMDVSNSGQWMDRPDAERSGTGGAGPSSGTGPASGTGMGLDNVRKRLQSVFPGRHKFEIERREDGVTVRIELVHDAHRGEKAA